MIKLIFISLSILYAENYRIDCNDVCDISSSLYSDFVCNTCNNNKRILNKCDYTSKYFNSVDIDEQYLLRNGIDEYCEDSNQLTQDLSDYFILNINWVRNTWVREYEKFMSYRFLLKGNYGFLLRVYGRYLEQEADLQFEQKKNGSS